MLLQSATLDQEKMNMFTSVGQSSMSSSADFFFDLPFLAFFLPPSEFKPVASLAVRDQSSIRDTGEMTNTFIPGIVLMKDFDQTHPMIVLPETHELETGIYENKVYCQQQFVSVLA